eukprot:scaffold43593_cov31-Tisochrysis_lutea.AAC.2
MKGERGSSRAWLSNASSRAAAPDMSPQAVLLEASHACCITAVTWMSSGKMAGIPCVSIALPRVEIVEVATSSYAVWTMPVLEMPVRTKEAAVVGGIAWSPIFLKEPRLPGATTAVTGGSGRIGRTGAAP